jgi:hypothetical protein
MANWTIAVYALPVNTEVLGIPLANYKHATIVLRDENNAIKSIINGGPLKDGRLATANDLVSK